METKDIIAWAKANSVSCSDLLSAVEAMARDRIRSWLEKHGGEYTFDGTGEKPCLTCVSLDRPMDAIVRSVAVVGGRTEFTAEIDDEEYSLEEDCFAEGQLCFIAELLDELEESASFQVGDRVSWDDPALEGELPDEELAERRREVYRIVRKRPDFALISNGVSEAEVPWSELRRIG